MNTASPINSSDTLFAGRLAVALHLDGTEQNIKVRQLRLSDYEQAIPLVDDEIAITAFCCVAAPSGTAPDQPLNKVWALTLQPECYERLRSLAREVNAKGFFSYAARHQEKERAENEMWTRLAADLPAELLKAAIENGKSPSRNSSPRPR